MLGRGFPPEDLAAFYSDDEDGMGKYMNVAEEAIQQHADGRMVRRQAQLQAAFPEKALPTIEAPLKILADRKRSSPLHVDEWGAGELHHDLVWRRKLALEDAAAEHWREEAGRPHDRRWLHVELDGRIVGNVPDSEQRIINRARGIVSALSGHEYLSLSQYYVLFVKRSEH